MTLCGDNPAAATFGDSPGATGVVSGTNALLAGNNQRMAVRITVQADDRDECASGFEVLLKALAGLAVEATPTLPPTRVTIANACLARLRFTLPTQPVD